MQNNLPAIIAYKAHPMRESIVKAIFFWLVVIFTIWGVWLNVDSIFLTFVAGAILIGSLNSFYLATIYRIGPDGASWKRLSGSRSIEWPRVRLVADERDGLFLSSFAGRSIMENFRGMYLPYRSNRDEILTLVRRYAPDAKGWKTPPDQPPTDSSQDLPSRNYFGHRR